MPERLMGTDCKFVGDMSTLVQIQLGPKIRRSIPPFHEYDITNDISNLSSRMIRKRKRVYFFFSIHVFLIRSDLSNDLDS